MLPPDWTVTTSVAPPEGFVADHRTLSTEVDNGLEAVQFAIAGSFAAFLAEGDPTRLKACQNSDCRWVLYDSTRSRTRRVAGATTANGAARPARSNFATATVFPLGR